MPYEAPPSSLATISEGPNDPAPEALCARPPDQLSGAFYRFRRNCLCRPSPDRRMALTTLAAHGRSGFSW